MLYSRSRGIAAVSFQVAETTTFYVMTFGDWQDTGRGSQVRGGPYRKHSTGLCGTGAGVKVAGPGRSGSDILVPSHAKH